MKKSTMNYFGLLKINLKCCLIFLMNRSVSKIDETNKNLVFSFLIDENNLQSNDDDDEQLNELNKQLWNEEYYPVASRLYQRLIEGNEYFRTMQIDDYAS